LRIKNYINDLGRFGSKGDKAGVGTKNKDGIDAAKGSGVATGTSGGGSGPGSNGAGDSNGIVYAQYFVNFSNILVCGTLHNKLNTNILVAKFVYWS
jgi:hypothetical protein